MLKNKIIIKNKKKHHHHHKKPTASVVLEPATAATLVLGNGDIPRGPVRQSSKDNTQEDDEGNYSLEKSCIILHKHTSLLFLQRMNYLICIS